MKNRTRLTLLAVIVMLMSFFVYSSCNNQPSLHSEEIGTGVRVSRAKTYSDLSTIVTDSQVIAIGTITKLVDSIENPDEYLYMTNYVFKIETLLKGEVPGEIIVSQPGTPATPWYVLKDDPLFDVGEKYLLFMNKNYLDTYYCYGPSARYKIENDKVYSMNYVLRNEVYTAPDTLDFNGMTLDDFKFSISEIMDTVRFFGPAGTLLLSGESTKIEYTLATGNCESNEVHYNLKMIDNPESFNVVSMPEGMDVTIEPERFFANPYQDYRSIVTITTDEEIITPGEYWILIEYSGESLSGHTILRVVIDEKKVSEVESMYDNYNKN